MFPVLSCQNPQKEEFPILLWQHTVVFYWTKVQLQCSSSHQYNCGSAQDSRFFFGATLHKSTVDRKHGASMTFFRHSGFLRNSKLQPKQPHLWVNAQYNHVGLHEWLPLGLCILMSDPNCTRNHANRLNEASPSRCMVSSMCRYHSDT